MDFSFTDEQRMLADQARRFFAERFPSERVAELAESEEGWDPASWTSLVELGWIGLSAPESVGGSGMSFIEETVLLEEAGYALFPGPLFATVALAQPALERSSDAFRRLVDEGAPATFAWAEDATGPEIGLEAPATRFEDGRLTGEKYLVPDAAGAQIAAVTATGPSGLHLVAADLSEARIEPASTMDATRRYGRVGFNGTPAVPLASGSEAEECISKIKARGRVGAAAEAVGVAQRALDLARSYVSERRQFEKPIGSYQAVSHQVSDSYMGVELARSLTYWAAWCVAHDEPQASVASAAAKSLATEVAVLNCERSIQVHGGVGFTWEHILHRYYKRAQWLESFDGFPARHRVEVAAEVLGASH